MQFSPLLEQLIEALRCLPGVGPKTAQRMAFQLLERGRDKGKHLANTLLTAKTKIPTVISPVDIPKYKINCDV